jgi:hypothetical protein
MHRERRSDVLALLKVVGYALFHKVTVVPVLISTGKIRQNAKASTLIYSDARL